MPENIVDATYTSVWDGGIEVTTNCKVNLDTKEVFDIEISDFDADYLEVLDEEFITLGDEKFEVIRENEIAVDEDYDGFWYK